MLEQVAVGLGRHDAQVEVQAALPYDLGLGLAGSDDLGHPVHGREPLDQ